MTIAPKKPRVEGGERGQRQPPPPQRQPPPAQRQAPPTQRQPPPPQRLTGTSDPGRTYDESGHRRTRVAKSVSNTKSLSAASSPAQPAEEPVNSDDEREAVVVPAAVVAAEEEAERLFVDRLKSSGLVIKAMGEDGACLFRAVADQEKNRDYFSQFVTEDWRDYIHRKRAADAHGNHVEIQAMAELFSRPIEVYRPGQSVVNSSGVIQPINTFQCQGASAGQNPPIRVSYHGTVHYNSVLEPWGPATVGVGLGLPGLEPSTAQTSALRDAAALSEQEGIEHAMLEDKLRATDREATTSDLTAQVARESYLDFIRDQEERLRKENAPCHSGSLGPAPSGSASKRSPKPTSSAKAGLASRPTSPKAPSPKATSPKTASPKASKEASKASKETSGSKEESLSLGGDLGSLETASILNALPASVFGLGDFDLGDDGGVDGGVLSRVLALSQQEYLESFKAPAKDEKKEDEKPTESNSANS